MIDDTLEFPLSTFHRHYLRNTSMNNDFCFVSRLCRYRDFSRVRMENFPFTGTKQIICFANQSSESKKNNGKWKVYQVKGKVRIQKWNFKKSR